MTNPIPFDFKAFFEQQAENFRSFILDLKPEEKAEVLKWLDDVAAVKADTALSSSERSKKINELKTSDVILLFLQRFLDLVLSKIPIDNKDMMKSGLAFLSVFVSAKNPRFAGISSIAFLAFRAALPQLVLSSQFDKISDYLRAELKKT